MGNKENLTKQIPLLFVIFGGLGDLSKRKLIPALFSLYKSDNFSESFAVVAVDIIDLSYEDFKAKARKDLEKYTSYQINDEQWEDFCNQLYYKRIDPQKGSDDYQKLQEFLSELDQSYHSIGNRIFYMAVAPELFEKITKELYSHGMLENQKAWQRIMVEKPFGSDLASASKLNRNISALISEDKIFRIDHYLGKEMVQNILAIRFSNSIFESLWNHNYIDHIQVLATESIGIESRGKYYEKAGVMRDMLQNHILQMIALVCMEPPVKFDSEYIRDEKVKILKNLRFFDDTKKDNIVLGQYKEGIAGEKQVPGYRQESDVSPDSNVATFIALKAELDNFRWGGVPIYIKSGKRLTERVSKIIISFKKLPEVDTFMGVGHVIPNTLVIKIQPDEGVFFQINAKVPGNDFLLEPVRMDYCQACQFIHNSPEAYERLITEAIRNNMALFTRWDELENAWKYIDHLERTAHRQSFTDPNYQAGSEGPDKAKELIERDGRKWWSDKKETNLI